MAFKRKVQRASSPVGYAWEVRWEDANGKERQKTFPIVADAENRTDSRGRRMKPRPVEKIAQAAADDADRFCVEIELELEKGNSTAPLAGRSQRFREVAELMQAANAHTLKPKTRRDTARDLLLHIYPTFGERRISTITTMDIEQWLAEQRTAISPETKQPYSQYSIRRWYGTTASVFKYAMQLRILGADPCVPVRIPKIDRHELTFLTPGQLNAVVDYMDVEPPDGLVVQFAAYTGLRAGELMGLRIRDVNLFARQPFVHVQRQAQFEPKKGWQYPTPKTRNSIRKVPLNRVLVARLRDHVAAHPHSGEPEALFWPGRRRGGPGGGRGALDYDVQFNLANFYKKHFLVALKELGIPAVRWHDLRHFYASACASAGIPIERAAKYMGHADISTMYKHYLHLFSDDHTDDMDRLAAVTERPALQRVTALGGRAMNGD